MALHLPDPFPIRTPCMTYLLKTFLSVQNGSEYRMNGSEKATKGKTKDLEKLVGERESKFRLVY